MAHSVSLSEYPLAYLITFHTYGSWLHGEAKGSVDDNHNRVESDFLPTDARRQVAAKNLMRHDAVVLGSDQRDAVWAAITAVCEHRQWEPLAINVRTNHVHVVVSAPVKPEKVMNDFKIWAMRKLREAQLVDAEQKTWSRHGSTRYLWDERAVENACRYVVEGQGVDLN